MSKQVRPETDASSVGLTPRLRFPAFRSDPSWEKRTLGSVTTRLQKKVQAKDLPPVSITAGQGFVLQSDKFGRDISGAQYKNYIHLHRGDFSYNKGNSKRFPQGCIYELKEFDEAAAPNAFISFRLKEGSNARFFQALFEKNEHGKELQRFITSGARSDGLLNINADDFFSIQLPVPSNLDEQKKIADCLTALDRLIDAHRQRLDALRDHKKALLKTIFPAPGESTTGFGEEHLQSQCKWNWVPLEQLCEILNSRRQPVSSINRTSGPYPYYGASGVQDYVNDYLFDEPLLLVGEDGAKWGANERSAFAVDGKAWVNNHAHVLRCKGIPRTVLEAYLTMADLRVHVSGYAPPKLTLGKLKAIPIPVPDDQDVTALISSALDGANQSITNQSLFCEQYDLHKSALLQQLFPIQNS